mmetsp:Transcript_742/g.1052  ORF Transcript_742/g.1052 Transcript_742/m.1052 type:complete len:83 (-) Transcript_742:208-456(-)
MWRMAKLEYNGGCVETVSVGATNELAPSSSDMERSTKFEKFGIGSLNDVFDRIFAFLVAKVEAGNELLPDVRSTKLFELYAR